MRTKVRTIEPHLIAQPYQGTREQALASNSGVASAPPQPLGRGDRIVLYLIGL